jgi:hypothetical protein
MKSLVLIVLMLSAGSFAQDAIPAGTILPVQLDSSGPEAGCCCV